MGVTVSDSLWPSLIASIAPIVLGAVTVHYKLFIEPEAEFRKRVSLQREKLIEQLAGRFASVLQHVRAIAMTPDNDLRGDGREEPDLVGDVARECYKLSTVLHRMEVIRTIVRSTYIVLLLTVALGIFGVFSALIWQTWRPYVFWCAVGLLVLQTLLILGVMRASAAMELYEDVA
ncbi:MAG: hypothetical protein L0Y44_06655 [Phycisphaerales bacterium]|nr:hypothetical protein [Phycisphaerales bacterium]